jgi:hypothetical protein
MKHRDFIVMALVLSLLAFVALFQRAEAAGTTFTVTSSADNGIGCTLRNAILSAEGDSAPLSFPCGPDNGAPYTIAFHISSGGVQTITPIGTDMAISSAMTIDGTTQPGCAMYPCIVLDGAFFSPYPFAIDISSSNSLVRGLVLTDKAGFIIDGGSNNVLQGNFVGTDVTGTNAGANNDAQVLIENGAKGNIIGGTTPAARNLICSNVYITGAATNGNIVEGNYIGTDVTGTKAIGGCGNDAFEVEIYLSSNNTIGGTSAGASNLISGNQLIGGIVINTANGNNIQGNFIGTDVTGTKAIANTNGIVLKSDGSSSPSNNVIGGTTAATRNIISGNLGTGIFLDKATANLIEGNYIGTDVTGTHALSNGGEGVRIQYGSTNSIGGTTKGAGNVIAFNKYTGVAIVADSAGGVSNAIRENSIHDNSHLGIDLGDDGVTPNSPHCAGTILANNAQNYPVLTSAIHTAKNIKGQLSCTPNTKFTIEFFSNKSCDPLGFGEGQSFLGSASVKTNAKGTAQFSVKVAAFKAGAFITATATDPAGNTSEFSKCKKAT